MFLKHVANKLRHDHGFSDLATSSPITEASSDALPAFSLDWPGPVTTEPVAQAIISPLEPDYIHRPVTANGVLLQPSPLQPLADLAQRSAAGYANIAGVLTATYPDMWREDLGRKVCVRYPNGDGWFNVVAGRCLYGATVDGMGGDGDDEAWLAAHLTLVVALRMMRQELPGVGNTRAAAALLQQILHQAHSEIMQLDVCGSTAVLLHACFHLQKDEYVFVFACTGDVEAYWFDSRRKEWRYLVEPIGPAANTLRLNSSSVPGAIGRRAANDKGQLRGHTNLQYGVVACRGEDMFLIGSDGVWDTLDAVQNGTPRHFGLPHDTWEGLTPAEVNRIVPLVPIFKQRRLGEATRDAVATGSPQAVVDAVVQHAMLSTRGERELFEIVDIESEGRASIYADTIEAKGMRDSLYANAKRASEASGELIFAKPDHVGVQAFRPCAILEGSAGTA